MSGSSGVSAIEQDEFTAILSGNLSNAQRVFGLADGTELLGSAFRLRAFAKNIEAPNKVKVAATLGLAAKLNRDVPLRELHRLWFLVAGAKFTLVKEAEHAIFQRWSLSSLEGPYAMDTMEAADL